MIAFESVHPVDDSFIESFNHIEFILGSFSYVLIRHTMFMEVKIGQSQVVVRKRVFIVDLIVVCQSVGV